MFIKKTIEDSLQRKTQLLFIKYMISNLKV